MKFFYAIVLFSLIGYSCTKENSQLVADYIPEVTPDKETVTDFSIQLRNSVLSFDSAYITGVAVHSFDPMANTEYETYFSQNVSNSFPAGVADRTYTQAGEVSSPEMFEAAYLERINLIPSADLFIENVVFNESTQMLNFTLRSEFVSNASNYRLGAILTENHVTGSGPDWAQSNSYANNANGPMGGYENLPSPVPASQMSYDHVARAILGGWEGVSGSLPIHVNAGESHSYDFSVMIEEDWDISKIKIIGTLINRTIPVVDNANVSDELIPTNTTALVSADDISISPNPTSDFIDILTSKSGELNIYDSNGRLESSLYLHGRSKIDVSHLPTGMYYVIWNDGEKVTQKKISISR